VLLEKDGDDQLYRSCEKWKGLAQRKVIKKRAAYNIRKEGWLNGSHIT